MRATSDNPQACADRIRLAGLLFDLWQCDFPSIREFLKGNVWELVELGKSPEMVPPDLVQMLIAFVAALLLPEVVDEADAAPNAAERN